MSSITFATADHARQLRDAHRARAARWLEHWESRWRGNQAALARTVGPVEYERLRSERDFLFREIAIQIKVEFEGERLTAQLRRAHPMLAAIVEAAAISLQRPEVEATEVPHA